MNAGSFWRSSAVALALLWLIAAPSLVNAQIAGDNVNMVTGTQWPGGDPFLQRQNEPSIAVSSANPQHLLAGANDYRSVDVPFPANVDKMPGDAWLGLFKSYNGGLTWQSVLLPGFPQDNSPEGTVSGMKSCGGGSCTSAADPVIRAAPGGLLYYSGIKFARGTTHGKVFVARFLDLNDKENGDPTAAEVDSAGLPTIATPTDPIRYVDQIDIASEPAGDGDGYFLDKPWIAVDRPRGNATCEITVKGSDGIQTTRTVPAGAIYLAYVRFAPGEVSSNILFKRSTDCGSTWSAPIKLNDSTAILNQAPSIAVDPITGYVYVTWRRVATPKTATASAQSDAIMVARSYKGTAFTKPRTLAPFKPFEQVSTGSMFRTNAFPSIAISVDGAGNKSWAHIVWAQRQGSYNEGHVVMSTAPVVPASSGSKESTDSCGGWNTAVPVDNVGITDDTMKRVFSRGHQFMPTVTFSQGKLMVFYYDSRLDHTAGEFLPNMVNGVFQPDSLGRFYREERVPIALYNAETGKNDPPESPTNVFAKPIIDDGTMTKVRHTVEVRVGAASPGPAPVFSSVQVSKYRFGELGYEPARLSVQPFHDSDTLSLETDVRKWLPVTDGSKYVRLQQFEVNPPNLPMFKNGTVPFLGDYVDIQGQAFVLKNGAWTFNTAPTASPVFHAVWTTNQDVKPPRPGTTWQDFTPMKLPSGQTVFDGTPDPAKTPTFCVPNTPHGMNEGIRNQNIYTSRITEGLHVSSPQNVKPLYADQTTSFVVSVYNDTSTKRSLRFAFSGPHVCSVAEGSTPATSCASFRRDEVVDHVDVEILPHSSASRSIFVRSTNADLPIVAYVTELLVQDPCTVNKCSCSPATIGLSGQVILNPPGSNPSALALAPPDGSTGIAPGSPEQVLVANVSTANVSTANVSTANVSTANISTANVSTANVSTANVSTANVSTANVTTANISTANVSTANVSTANVSTANVSTANVSTANVSTANVSTANVSTASISDLNYQVTNNGNTTTSYTVQFVCADPNGCGSYASTPIKLMVNKFYTVPGSLGCELYAEPRPVLVSNGGFIQDRFVDPTTDVNPNVTDGSAGNASLSLAPGESAQITLRGPLTLGQMATLGSKIAPAVVPHGQPVVSGQTYATLAVGGYPTETHIFVAPGVFTVEVWGGNSESDPLPTGTVTFIQDGTKIVGTLTLEYGSASFEYTLPVGSTLVAYYGGDRNYSASSAGPVDNRVQTQTWIYSPTSPPSLLGQPVHVEFGFDTFESYGVPGGTLELLDGETSLGTASFTCGNEGGYYCQGAMDITGLALGDHVLTARYNGTPTYAPSTSSPMNWSVVASLPLVVTGQLGRYDSCVNVRYGQSNGSAVSGATVNVYQGAAPALLDTYVESAAGSGSYCPSLGTASPDIPDGTFVTLVVTKGAESVTGTITMPFTPQSLRFNSAAGTPAVNTGGIYWYITGGDQTATASWTLVPGATQPSGATYYLSCPGDVYCPVYQYDSAATSLPVHVYTNAPYAWPVALFVNTAMTFPPSAAPGSGVSSNYRSISNYALTIQP